MLDALVRHVVSTVRAKTGANTAMEVCIPIAAVAGLFALAFLSWAFYMWLGELYGPVMAALAVAAVYVVITVVALIWMAASRRRAIEAAKAELAAEPNWLADPALLTVGLQVARSLGWRKLLPLAVAGVLAVGLSLHANANGARQSTTT